MKIDRHTEKVNFFRSLITLRYVLSYLQFLILVYIYIVWEGSGIDSDEELLFFLIPGIVISEVIIEKIIMVVYKSRFSCYLKIHDEVYAKDPDNVRYKVCLDCREVTLFDDFMPQKKLGGEQA